MGLERLGRFTVLKHLASGGMADVLIARSDGIEGFERHVVVKRIRAELAKDQRFIQMFLDEARVAAGLHHQNIVQVHDIGESNGEYFFTMEYLHGEDLRRILSTVSRSGVHMPLGYLIAIISAVASGLHYAHERRGPDGKPQEIVHRDVSPSNILVGYDGSVKVVDFGIAKAAMRQTETKSGSLKGKVSYMSPEQCKGEPVDRRSDVFALGVVLYELATTTRLFKHESEYMIMDAIVNGKIPRPRSRRPDLPVELDAIIMNALAVDANQRYASAEALRIALEQFAVRAGLTTTGSAVATYMHQLFGARPEPWRDLGTATMIEPIGSDDLSSDMPVRNSWTEIPRDAVLAEATEAGDAKTITDSKRRMMSGPLNVVMPMLEPSRITEIAPHETRPSAKFGFEQQAAQIVALPPPPPSRSAMRKVVFVLPMIALAGVLTWQLAFRSAPPPAPVVVQAAVVPAVPAAPVAHEPAKVEIQLDADVANARVVFRRHVSAAPMKAEIPASDIVELIELSAPGYKTQRYWLTFDRATKLRAHLAKGAGTEEATEEQTLVALGEMAAAQAPTAAASPVAVAAAPHATSDPVTTPAPRRKIGRSAAEDPAPATTVAVATPTPAPAVVEPPPSEPVKPIAAPPVVPVHVEPAHAEPPRTLAPAALRALLATSSKIDPPDVVANEMARDGKKTASAMIKVCVSAAGEVTTASVMKSSGYAAYDERAVAGVRGWRYRPYVADGHAVPACSAVVLTLAAAR